ncbi:MAG: hypothetical protein HY543_05915 [Deltaproteobacteria bacterium]|nr:hypothetical protein [Deltaproteobacteria bacterium]
MALAILATPAFAATNYSRTSAQQPLANGSRAYAAAESGLVTNTPALFSNGRYVGWDPDPAIRLDLLRQGPDQPAN